MDGKERLDMDQMYATIAELSEQLPIQWGKMFHGCLKEGFTTEQAMDLIKTSIMAQHMGAGGLRDDV